MCKPQRIILAIVFVISAALKILVPSEHSAFSRVLGSHDLANMATIAIAAIEMCVAIILATRWWKSGVNLSIIFMVASFLASAIMSLNGISAQNCGCFGALRVTEAVHWGVILGTSLVATSSLVLIDRANENKRALAH